MIKRMVCSHRSDTDQMNPRGRHRAEMIELVSMGDSPSFARSPRLQTKLQSYVAEKVKLRLRELEVDNMSSALVAA